MSAICRSVVRRLDILEPGEGLDPIRVDLDDVMPGAGRLTVSCWDMAWVGYWGSIGKRSLLEFVLASSAEYLAANLGRGTELRQGARNRAYLVKIMAAVQRALRVDAQSPSAALTDADRLLLELAALAVGVDYDQEARAWPGLLARDAAGNPCIWNPLASDTDVLRLALKLGLCITDRDGRPLHESHPGEGNPMDKTRRALVERAAQIGQSLRSELALRELARLSDEIGMPL